jgi:hypothetical protein
MTVRSGTRSLSVCCGNVLSCTSPSRPTHAVACVPRATIEYEAPAVLTRHVNRTEHPWQRTLSRVWPRAAPRQKGATLLEVPRLRIAR